MRKFFELFGLIALICFSFFYTEKVMFVISEKDPLKIEINDLKDKYKKDVIEAIINEDSIIPGVSGKKVNVEKSYKKMRGNNVFNEKMLVYDEVYPNNSLENNKDKYVIKGSNSENEVSFLFVVKDDIYLDKVIKILENKNIIGNFFVDYNFLINNINKLKMYTNHHFYSYQEDYSYEKLIISNNIIKISFDNNPSYCLVKNKNISNLNICSYANLNTILPNIFGNFKNIKENLANGSIILFDLSLNTLEELDYICDFIKGKGYKIVSIAYLLDSK